MTGPLLVLSAWAVVGTAGTLLTAMRGKPDATDAPDGPLARAAGGGSTPA
ncbi:hypothetical protein [Streptomyces sp. NBC_00441]